MARSPRPVGGLPRRCLAVGLGSLLMLMVSVEVRADDISNKQHQKQQQQGLIASLQTQITTNQSAEVQIQAQIAFLAAQIAQTEAVITAQQAKLDQITAHLVAERAQLAATEAELARDKQALATEMRLLYEATDQSTPLNNLVGAQSFNDFWTKFLDTRRIAARLQQTVDKVNRLKLQIAEQVARIAAEQLQQQAVVKELQAQRAQLAAEKAAQQQAEQQLAAQIAADQQRVAEAQAAIVQLDAQIAQLQAAQAAAAAAAAAHHSSTGFAWPESGPISQGFGCTSFWFEQYDPNCASRHFHNGLDIAAGCDNAVSATAGGLVYTYWTNWGFGHYIIVIHGNGWASLYGHLDTFAVGNGQWVGRGQTIGWEGTSGNSTGCHLHFGLSLNGNWQNPLNYLP